MCGWLLVAAVNGRAGTVTPAWLESVRVSTRARPTEIAAQPSAHPTEPILSNMWTLPGEFSAPFLSVPVPPCPYPSAQSRPVLAGTRNLWITQ